MMKGGGMWSQIRLIGTSARPMPKASYLRSQVQVSTRLYLRHGFTELNVLHSLHRSCKERKSKGVVSRRHLWVRVQCECFTHNTTCSTLTIILTAYYHVRCSCKTPLVFVISISVHIVASNITLSRQLLNLAIASVVLVNAQTQYGPYGRDRNGSFPHVYPGMPAGDLSLEWQSCKSLFVVFSLSVATLTYSGLQIIKLPRGSLT